MLPCEMAQMSWLRILKVSRNELSNIIFGIRDMADLEVLHLQNNKLKMLPSGMH